MRPVRAYLLLLSIAACCCARIDWAMAADSSKNPSGSLPEPIAWRQLSFSIPFKVATEVTEQPSEVRLYVSKDRGVKWELGQTVGPQQRSFMFRAPGDGEYWFQIRTADRQGHITPDVGGTPELCVIVDTLPPRLELSATRGSSGEIKANWQAVDPLLNVDSLKIEYQNNVGQWRPVALDRPASESNRSTSTGSLTWFPDDAPTTALVRAEISDRAGNVSVAQAKAEAARTPSGPAITPSPFDNTAQASPTNPPWLSLGNSATPTTGSTFQSQPIGATRPPLGNSSKPPLGSTAQSSAGAVSWPGERSSTPWSADHSSDVPFGRHPIPADDHFLQQPSGITNQSSFGPASTDRLAANPGWETINPAIQSQAMPANGNESPRSAPSTHFSGSQSADNNIQSNMGSKTGTMANAGDNGSLGSMLPPGVRPLMVRSRSFDMDYDVDAVGPSGIAKVELWGTQDGGHSWRSFGVDPDKHSPIRAKVEGEGLYGFRLVVQSGGGLGGLPPNSGDRPDIWVLVDLTKPTVHLIDTRIGQSQDAGTLFIRWQATDNALAVRPITLMFSEQPGGPWSTIAAGLENSGQYAWRPDSRVPDKIYLRIEARDEAGNIGAFEAPQPVSLDGIRPGGHIQGVRSIDDTAAASHSFNDTANGARIYQFSR